MNVYDISLILYRRLTVTWDGAIDKRSIQGDNKCEDTMGN